MKKTIGLYLASVLCYAVFITGVSLSVIEPTNLRPLLIGALFSFVIIFFLHRKWCNSGKGDIQVRVINKSGHDLPAYATSASAGMDIRACLSTPLEIAPGEKTFVPTGLFIELPVGYEAQIRPRSGLSAKHAVTVLNTPGTIDADYRGEIKIILINLSRETFRIENGDRIAQMVIARHEQIRWIPTDRLSDTDRGEGGFGHTGKH